MRRLRSLDSVLLVVLVLLWAACFVLHVRNTVQGRLAWISVSVQQGADGYLTVRGFWPDSDAEKSGLTVGDRLTRLGNTDLHGVTAFGFVARAYATMDSDLRVPLSFTRGDQSGKVLVPMHPLALPWRAALLILSFVVTAVIGLLRVPKSRPVRAFVLASLAYSFHWTFFYGESLLLSSIRVAIFCLASLLMFPLMLRAALQFPEENAPIENWPFAWLWLFALYGPFETSATLGMPFSHSIGRSVSSALTAALIVALLGVLTRNFLRAGPLGRRRIKWVVYGMYIGTVPVFAADVVTTFAPAWVWLHEFSTVAIILIPPCILIALTRFNLFDIDRLISTTAAYSILFVLLLAGGMRIAPQLAEVTPVVGLDLASTQIALSFLFIIVLLPSQRYLRPQIERLFFRERYIFEQGVRALLPDLSACRDSQALFDLVGKRLYGLLKPESCIIYERTRAHYKPVVAHGSAVPPTFELRTPLIQALEDCTTSFDMERWRHAARVSLSPTDRNIVNGLRTTVILPIQQSSVLAFFICLGRKQSGDIYTATDLALLKMVSDRIAATLSGFDAATVQGLATPQCNTPGLSS